ncbi:hypothetical protein ACJJTC_002099 [Scirpophaga incertulas]
MGRSDLRVQVFVALLVAALRAAVGLETLPVGVILNEGDTFDYIVVGAGAAGAAVAARLAQAGHDVLLVEAGGDPTVLSHIPGAAVALLGGSLDWQYDTLTNNKSCLSYRNQQCRFSRGRCLGGSTSINSMIYTRGTPKDFDELGIPGWTWEDMKPYFLRYEGLKVLDQLPPTSIPYHNTTGTMSMEFFTKSINPWHGRLMEGYQALKIPYNPDVNAKSIIGVTKVVGYVYEQKRMTTARAYLTRDDVKKNLKVAKLTTCTGVIMDGNVAQGITVSHGIFRRKLRLFARKEVVLSAGAIGTPHILMLSGIGHAEHLREFGIPVVADLPVGDNMTDHLLPLVFIKVDSGMGLVSDLLDLGAKALQAAQMLLSGQSPLGNIGLTDVNTFLNTLCYDFETKELKNDRPECEIPTLQFIHAYTDRGVVVAAPLLLRKGTDLNDNVVLQLVKGNAKYGYIVLSPLVLQSFSSGTVRLASKNPLVYPAIMPNYLSDDRDLDEMVRALRILEDLVEKWRLMQYDASIMYLDLEGCPPRSAGARAYWECYARHMTHTTFHSVGTAALGRVLDARLRVRGVRRLRVADLSALPALPRGNTAAAAIALGERLADFILSG